MQDIVRWLSSWIGIVLVFSTTKGCNLPYILTQDENTVIRKQSFTTEITACCARSKHIAAYLCKFNYWNASIAAYSSAITKLIKRFIYSKTYSISSSAVKLKLSKLCKVIKWAKCSTCAHDSA